MSNVRSFCVTICVRKEDKKEKEGEKNAADITILLLYRCENLSRWRRSLSHPSCSVQFLDFYIACRPSPDRCRLQREDGGRRWEERKKNCRYLLLLCLRERGRKLQREERRRRKREMEKYLLPSFLGDATHLFFSVSHLAILPPSLQSLAFIPVLITVPSSEGRHGAR